MACTSLCHLEGVAAVEGTTVVKRDYVSYNEENENSTTQQTV